MNARRLSTAFHAAVAAVALLTIAAPARADDPIRGDAKCTDSDAANASAPFFVNPSFVACTAHYAEGAAPQTTLVTPFAGYGDFKYVGQTTKTDGPGAAGPFDPFGTGLTFGTLTLKAPQTGPFIVALSSAGDYSFYLYDPAIAGGTPVSSLFISTYGTTNIIRGPYELDYANLYTQVIPEPSTYALFLAGLGVTALALRRRKTA